jgi:hypothetical protein
MITKNRKNPIILKEMQNKSVSLTARRDKDFVYYTYDCEILLDQIEAYKSNARLVDLEVGYDRDNQIFTLLGTGTTTDYVTLNDNLLNSSRKNLDYVNTSIENNKKSSRFSDSVDLFENIKKYTQFTLEKTDYRDLYRTQIKYVSGSDSTDENRAYTQLLDSNVVDNSFSSERAVSQLVRDGIDPVSRIIPKSLTVDPQDARKGLGRAINAKEDKLTSTFATRTNLSSTTVAQDQSLSIGINKSLTSDGILPIRFTFRDIDIVGDNVLVTLTIKDDEGVILQQKSYAIDHASNVQKCNLPKSMPSAGFQITPKNELIVNVFNTDENIKELKILTKQYRKYVPIQEQDVFQEIGIVDANSDIRYFRNKFNIKSNAVQMIRALPCLESGLVLGNIVGKSYNKLLPDGAGVIYTYFNQDRVFVNILDTPASYEFVQILRRNVTKKERNFTQISNVLKIDNGNVVFQDRSINSESVYEYTAKLIDSRGKETRLLQKSVVRTSNYASGTTLVVSLTSSTSSDAGYTNTFQIDVNLSKDTDTTKLLEFLKSAGIDNYYETEFLKLSADLKNIVKVNVKRINRLTGEIAELGIKDAGEFVDVASGPAIYLFEGLIRGQADLFEEAGNMLSTQTVQNLKDPIGISNIAGQGLSSKKEIAKVNYTQKFLSKKSLLRGTLSYGKTLDYSEDDSGFLSGRMGITSEVAVINTTVDPVIQNFSLTSASEDRRLLQFDVTANPTDKQIDFFLIVTLRGQVRSTVGVCHYIREQVRQNFFDNVTNLKNGKITYIVIPIGVGGSSLDEVTSQEFEVL